MSTTTPASVNPSAGKPLEVGVLLLGPAIQFTDIAPVDVLTTLTPEFLSVLRSENLELQEQAVPMNISYITEEEPDGASGGLFQLSAGARIAVTHSLTSAPALDILFIPGPPPSYKPTPPGASFIAKHFSDGATILSVCTGILATAASGILAGKTATAPLGLLPMLREQFPKTNWTGERRWERDGNVWTSGTVFNGIDMVSAFMKERFGDKREIVEELLAIVGAGARAPDYTEQEKAAANVF